MRITPTLRFRSNYEREVCTLLDDDEVKFEYETMNLYYEVSEQRKYTPDVILPNGIILELKGRFTTADRKKMLLVIKQHPDLDIRMVFQRHTNKLFKGSLTTYSEWCNKKGIKWASKTVPKEWIKEPRKHPKK
jgi:hypothetical protein|tara:strand:- start:322 stop:720 length:399 start_codon:yes stop_codon:yes gene_type:complete